MLRPALIWVIASLVAVGAAGAEPRCDQTPTTLPCKQVLDPGKARRHHGELVMAGGGLLVLASGLLSWHEKAVYDQYRAGALQGDRAAIDQDNRAHDLVHWYGTSLFAAGAITGAVGAYLYFTAPEEKLWIRRIAPAVGPGQVGLSFSGAF